MQELIETEVPKLLCQIKVLFLSLTLMVEPAVLTFSTWMNDNAAPVPFTVNSLSLKQYVQRR